MGPFKKPTAILSTRQSSRIRIVNRLYHSQDICSGRSFKETSTRRALNLRVKSLNSSPSISPPDSPLNLSQDSPNTYLPTQEMLTFIQTHDFSQEELTMIANKFTFICTANKMVIIFPCQITSLVEMLSIYVIHTVFNKQITKCYLNPEHQTLELNLNGTSYLVREPTISATGGIVWLAQEVREV